MPPFQQVLGALARLRPAAKLLPAAMVLAAALAPAGAQAARRALVVGIGHYQAFQSLANARADAESIAAALAKAGYVVALEKDRSLKELQASLRAFRQSIGTGDEVVFYFSGHGVQIDGMNYLLPSDIRGDSSEEQVKDDAVSLGKVLDDLGQRKPRLTLAIVDACRNNPFARLGRSVGSRTLVPIPIGSGQMVIYAAGDGQLALDRLGENDSAKNGLFARVFVREMLKPGVPIREVVYAVREEVATLAERAGRQQVPALYDQARGNFYFFPPVAAAASVPATPAAVPDTARPVITSREAGWVSATDGDGRTVVSRVVPPGEYLVLGGRAPWTIKLGNARAMELSFRGKTVSLQPFTRDNVARVELK